MVTETNCLLKQIITELKELNNRVLTKTNNELVLEHDTTTTKIYQIVDLLGERGKANTLTIYNVGGGFTYSINGGIDITAILYTVVENEDIHSIKITGTGTGTAILRIGSYIPKYYSKE